MVWCPSKTIEDGVFLRFFLVDLSRRKAVLLRGGRGNTKEKFPLVMLNSKSYTYQSLRVKPLEISYSSVTFFSDRDEVILVADEFVLMEEFRIRQCVLPTSEEHDSPEEFESSNFRPLLCYVPAVPKYLIHLTVNIIEGHLCLIMSGCSLGYK